jgi:hypothetical protein
MPGLYLVRIISMSASTEFLLCASKSNLTFPKFVNQNQRMLTRSTENSSHTAEIKLEAALRDSTCFSRAELCENLICQRNTCFIAGEKTANVCHIDEYSDLQGTRNRIVRQRREFFLAIAIKPSLKN